MKVTDLQQNQLTSKRVIEMQLQQQQKFFLEQVVTKEPIALVTKSRKGDQVFMINPSDMKMIHDYEETLGEGFNEQMVPNDMKGEAS